MRRRGLGLVLVGCGAALALLIGYQSEAGRFLWTTLLAKLTREAYYTQHSWIGMLAWRTALDFTELLLGLFAPMLVVASLATVSGWIARSVAWARVRDGKADPLARLRSRHRLQRVLIRAPAVLASVAGLMGFAIDLRHYSVAFDPQEASFFLFEALSKLLVTCGVAALVYAATRAGAKALLAPVATEATAPKEAGEVVYSAVAVTARTRAVVGTLAAATLGMIAFTLVAPGDPRLLMVLAAYVAVAMAAPFVLRRVSRIAVGIDGVWVRDASHAHYFAYQDLDEARPRGADLELVQRGRAVLRLQMHGDDAGRRDEVVMRMTDGIARSRESTSRGAEMVVQTMPRDQVVASTMGGDRYRLPSISREQLWDLVEGAAANASTRTAAAEVLSVALDDSERARLRVAAAQCAEPRLRVALEMLAGGGEDASSLEEAGEDRRERRVGVR
jgi:hypothetical protein